MKQDLIKDIGIVIRKLRNSQGLSIEKAAHMANIHPTYLAQVEKGHRNLSIKALQQIAAALGVKLTSLLPDNPIKKQKGSHIDVFANLTDDMDDKQKEAILGVVKELTNQIKKL